MPLVHFIVSPTSQVSIISIVLHNFIFVISLILNEFLHSLHLQLDTHLAGDIAGWNLLCSFVKELSAPPSAIDGILLKTTLGLKLLAGSGLITDEKIHERKSKKILTGLVYKQQKYNLLREETEGYSKLVVVLCSIPSYPEDVSQYVRQVLSLLADLSWIRIGP